MIKTFAKAGVAGLALAGFITSAQATGLGSGDGSWAGVYVGGHAGGGWGDADIGSSVFFAPGFSAETNESFDMDGWLAGAHIGANVQHGAWVIGGEFSLSAAGIDGSKSSCSSSVFSQGNDSIAIDLPCKKDDEWLALAMGRFGYAPGAWMGYVTAGVAVAGQQTTFDQSVTFSDGNDSITLGPAPFQADSSTDVGFAIGGGAEFQLGHGLVAGVEYIHAEFNDARNGDGLVVLDHSQDLDIVRARLSMMLDGVGNGAAATSKPGAGGYAGILPASGNTWSGVYFGGHAGYGWGETDVTAYGFFADGSVDRDSFDMEGWLAGAHLGGMVQRGNIVFGTELSLSAARIDGSKEVNCGGEFPGVQLSCKKDDEWLLLAMSRIGYAPSNWMVYATYGLAIVGSQTDTTVRAPQAQIFGAPFASGVNTDAGFAIGGGAEVKLGSGIIAGVEYIHADFDDARNGSGETVFEWEQDIDIVRARLSLMLNACCDEAGAPSKTNMASVAAPGGWAGFYFGSNAGLGWADTDVSVPIDFDGTKATDSFELDGYLAGVHMGGNVQHGALVLGGEISVSGGEIDGSKGPDCFDEERNDSFECKKDDKWLMLAMGRLGYAPGAWMGYVTAGAAVVGFQTDTVDDGDPQTAGADTDLGWAVGGGVEVEVMPNVIAGVEYIHAGFDGATDSADSLTWEQDLDLVRGRLSYKFGGGCCEAAPAAVPFK